MAAKLAVTAGIAVAFVGLIGWISPPKVQWPLVPERPYQVAVFRDQATFDLPFAEPNESYLLVVANLADDASPRQVTLTSEAIASAETTHLLASPLLTEPDKHCEAGRTAHPAATVAAPAAQTPPQSNAATPCTRNFWLKVGRKDSRNPGAWREVQTDLLMAGRHAAVYADQADNIPLETAAAVVQTFDNEVFPRLSPWLGTVTDVDGDGRLAIVLTSWLSRLDEGRLALGGMVASADFNDGGQAPFSNRADILYLNADVKPGQHLATLLAHEYTHAAVCSVRREQTSLLCPSQVEEGWLNEALAHVGENLQGPTWTNLDYRIAARLASNGTAPLSLPYGARQLGRDPQVRGSGYLFLRWCVERFGPELLTELVQGPRSGIGNLEAATGERFDRLYRQFAVELFLGWPENGGPERETPATAGASTGNTFVAAPRCFGHLGRYHLAGPRFHEIDLEPDGWRSAVSLAGAAAFDCAVALDRAMSPADTAGETVQPGSATAQVAGTSHAYFVLRTSTTGPRRVRLNLESGGTWQLTLVRLSSDRPRLTIRPTRSYPREGWSSAASHAATITLPVGSSGLVELEHLAWGQDPANGSETFVSGSFSLRGRSVQPGESLQVELPHDADPAALASGGWLHVLGRDAAGRPVSAWCELEQGVELQNGRETRPAIMATGPASGSLR